MPLSTYAHGPGVVIRGSGVAASCCSRLLWDAGIPLSGIECASPRVPTILIGEGTQALLRDLFGRSSLFEGRFAIESRIVAWGERADPVELPHHAVVISEDVLLERLGSVPATPDPPKATDWTVYASRPLPAPGEEQSFGSRMASATAVEFSPHSKPACWIESLDEGWLFLLPDSRSTGWLVAVGNSRDHLLSGSRLIAGLIRSIGSDGGTFPAHPRIADPLCGPGWMACGSAAMAFDPICGDGSGAAAREAILSTAVIRAIAAGGDVDRLLAHYRSRLIAGLLRHLQLCRSFYVSGGRGSWWGQETAALDRGIAWCDETLRAAGPFRYRLRGLELESIA